MNSFSEVVEATGHLIDSQIMTAIFDTVIACGATYDVVDFQIGRNNDEVSKLKLRVIAQSQSLLDQTLADLTLLGCHRLDEKDAALKPAPKDRCVPPDFYSTTNNRTSVRHQGRWLVVEDQRMDAMVCINGERAVCRKLRDVKAGDLIVCGNQGVRVTPDFKERDRMGFAFMANEISSERRVETAVKKIAHLMEQVKAQKGKIVFVAGPVVVHTGGVEYLCQLIRAGYVNVLLSGNALAVHDIENALYGTSLGLDLEHGMPINEGHKNHMRAINAINTAGSIKDAVESGVLKKGIMHDCVRHGVSYVLAGSIRDDGPLPDTEMDMVKAQNDYAGELKGASLVICLSSMLHSIGVGNMLPSSVPTVCVDINPAVVTKLSDRGSSHAIGVVTDVGLFLNLLSRHLSGVAG